MRRFIFSIGLIAALGWGCSRSGAPQPFRVLNTESESLKRAFNADRGKVRVLMLVSPT